ncbi:metabolite traffic protein EboE [Actinoplanes sp. DH11]|uniref:metabolite traffic protein EboE n=1 Tax=Actinoplanes sp. DH11 TaxID=2857011 RepID=UPI001E51C0DD|nr:metabolite traffic protein EboE [Actinoplanes sp. DH11]
MHLSYCTNVHPAEDLDGIVAQFDTYAVPVREHLREDRLGLGLWLAAPVAAALAEDPALRRRLRHELDARGLEVVTLNGFPYSAFQAPVVKHAVYHPDWTTPDRLDYTLNLARVLVDLLPDHAERGSISTLPLAWRTPWDAGRESAALSRLDALAKGLADISGAAGRPVRVGLEPEPGCVIETTEQAAAQLSRVDSTWLGVCLDLAHLACAWEQPAAAVERLRAAGVPIVKVQISAALEAADGTEPALREYVEPRFLHQTRSPAGESSDDLDEALGQGYAGPWRIHYHVPLHATPEAPLRSTVPVARAAMKALFAGSEPACDHFDVETYTWGVLPPAQRPRDAASLAAGIAAEVAFAQLLLGEVAR